MSTHAYARRTREHDRRAITKPREINPASRLGLQHPAASAIINARRSPQSPSGRPRSCACSRRSATGRSGPC
jgi:hypothetical protein